MADLLSRDHFGPVYAVENPDFPLHQLCTAFPRAGDEDITEMCRITRAIGCILNDPVIVWRGEIIDGGNRQHVARLCGVPLEARDFLGEYTAARTFVLLKNLGRRHLTGTQRAASILRLHDVDAKNGYVPADLRKTVAEQAQVSPETVRKVMRVQEDGGDEALDRLAAGTSSLRDELSDTGDPTGRSVPAGDRPEAPPDVLLDDEGAEVPAALLDVWRSRAKFRETRASFKACLDGLRSLLRDPGGHGLSVEHERAVKELVSDLDAKMPSLVCCHCGGTGLSSHELSTRRWRMQGKEDQVGKCYCCLARGYLLKDEPRPGPEWESQARLAS